jgi:hypothetical protein
MGAPKESARRNREYLQAMENQAARETNAAAPRSTNR